MAIAIAVSVVVVSVWPLPELGRRIDCQSTMKRIATAAKVYGLPDGPDEAALVRFGESAGIPLDELYCQSSGKCNYIIVPRPPAGGQFDNRTVVMYEPKSNHGDGGNVVFADGHTTFARGAEYDRIVHSPTHWWEEEGAHP